MASVKVAVRVRPFGQREMEMGAKVIVEMDGKLTRLQKPKRTSMMGGTDNTGSTVGLSSNDFTYDHSYWSFDGTDKNFASQDQVYEDLGSDVINSAFQGYNACIFAYGQTGSGKTFTMMGTSADPGLIPRICQAMFARMKKGQQIGTGYRTKVSYLEIYNERVMDLIGNAENYGNNLRVREHRTLGPYVEHLSQHTVSDYEEIQEYINKGNTLRTTASTNMNDSSSRSHAIFTITFTQAGFMDDMPSETVSKIHLVDLAGSERANATGATGQRLKEGGHINKSLVTLGSVISALAEQTQVAIQNKKSVYIPYRDSVLTWLLKDSLGGNSKTIMIAAISPADCNYSETLSTLRYANRAKNIINKPTINEDPNVKLIRELREEIMKLKGLLTGDKTTIAPSVAKMLEDLQKKEAQEKVLTEEWTEKWRESQNILREQKALGLRMSGVGVVLDSEVPHLIGIHDDISTGVTLYSLNEGETVIGSLNETDDEYEEEKPNIILSGMGMLPKHCVISLKNAHAEIIPMAMAQCWLNGVLIKEPTAISQGDILLLGRTNMFRFNNPAEAAKLRKGSSRSRLDLSRLSLFAASRENLFNNSLYCCTDDEISFTCPLKREQSNNNLDLLLDSQVMNTNESSLKHMHFDRIQMEDYFEGKIQKLTEELQHLESSQFDKLKILNCRERELLAKKEMFLWQNSNAQMQSDVITKQLSALEGQLDDANKILNDFISEKVQELQSAGKLDKNFPITASQPLSEDLCELLIESFPDLPIRSTINANRDQIKQIENNLIAKEVMLTECSAKQAFAAAEMIRLDQQHYELILQRRKYENQTMHIDKHSMEQSQSESEPEQSKLTLPIKSTNDTINHSFTSSPHQLLHKSHFESFQQDDTATSTINGNTNTAYHLQKQKSICCSMQKLRQDIAAEKAKLMKSLELNCDKSILDEGITRLQELQRQYVNCEKEVGGCDHSPCLSAGDESCLSGSDEEHHRHCVQGHIETDDGFEFSAMYERVGSASRSLPPFHDYETEFCISIPNFILRGAGKKTHYEYEIKFSLPNEKWSILRRYSRFRELHLMMKNRYGDSVAALQFPRREFFFQNSETVARNRRRQLEMYLRRLLVVCSKIPQCPLFDDGTDGSDGLTKSSLSEFSPFFRKGLFECGKHGTG